MAETSTRQVLEFGLEDERYCVDIEYVAEIVDVNDLTAVPNAPPAVEGVMDLRGRTTAIIDPKVLFDIDGETPARRILVFDPDTVEGDGARGWLVDDVDQVIQTSEDELQTAPVEDESGVRGVIKRDDSFTIWVEPAAIDPTTKA